jgi:hypothetical protein
VRLVGDRVQPILVERGSPQQNPNVEHLNGTIRYELLNGGHFRQSPRGVRRKWLWGSW